MLFIAIKENSSFLFGNNCDRQKYKCNEMQQISTESKRNHPRQGRGDSRDNHYSEQIAHKIQYRKTIMEKWRQYSSEKPAAQLSRSFLYKEETKPANRCQITRLRKAFCITKQHFWKDKKQLNGGAKYMEREFAFASKRRQNCFENEHDTCKYWISSHSTVSVLLNMDAFSMWKWIAMPSVEWIPSAKGRFAVHKTFGLYICV